MGLVFGGFDVVGVFLLVFSFVCLSLFLLFGWFFVVVVLVFKLFLKKASPKKN